MIPECVLVPFGYFNLIQELKIDKVRKYIAIGYCIIVALIGSIAYFYQQELSQMEVLEDETKRIHILRENVLFVLMRILELRELSFVCFSASCESDIFFDASFRHFGRFRFVSIKRCSA